ncbi:MAG: hypothetical protein Q7Q71_07145 [Verrucomicrobiota bacterium JB023]|nr:hypothetical protein [Verrucomicrobiota bacterium JB023]
MSEFKYTTRPPEELSARCHEIQTGLGFKEVPDFDNLRDVGMAVRLALHIRGLPTVNFATLRMVASHYLGIPGPAVKSIVEILAEVEFVKIQSEGRTIKAVVPDVPYYEAMYSTLGIFAAETGFNESEQLALDMLCRLSKSPEKVDALETKIGAEHKLFERALTLGKEGSYLRVHRARGRDIALSPTYFSENAEIFADMVAGKGSGEIQHLMKAIQAMQGVPLSIIEKNQEVGGIKLSPSEIQLLKRLAQDGAVKPPSISTDHAGENFFLFTPTPAGAALSPTKRDIYEKAMAIVAAVRQGQFLPQKYAIRYPSALINKLRNNLKLGKSTSEASQQYKQLVHMRVAQLIPVGYGRSELRIIDTPENREALDMAYKLVISGASSGAEVDDEARKALQKPHSFIESLVASGELVKREKVELSQDQQLEMENLFLK